MVLPKVRGGYSHILQIIHGTSLKVACILLLGTLQMVATHIIFLPLPCIFCCQNKVFRRIYTQNVLLVKSSTDINHIRKILFYLIVRLKCEKWFWFVISTSTGKMMSLFHHRTSLMTFGFQNVQSWSLLAYSVINVETGNFISGLQGSL